VTVAGTLSSAVTVVIAVAPMLRSAWPSVVKYGAMNVP
jgi:hypothetical protein